MKRGSKTDWMIAEAATRFNPPIMTDRGNVFSESSPAYAADVSTAGLPVGKSDTFQVMGGPSWARMSRLGFPAVQTCNNS